MQLYNMGMSHDPGLCSPVLYWNLILKYNNIYSVSVIGFVDL